MSQITDGYINLAFSEQRKMVFLQLTYNPRRDGSLCFMLVSMDRSVPLINQTVAKLKIRIISQISWEYTACAQSLSHVQLFATPWTACSPPGSSVHGDSPGKNTGVGCHAPLQGIFPTQGSNPGLPHCWQILYHLSHQGSLIYSEASIILSR